MTILDRTLAPPIREITFNPVSGLSKCKLDNGIDVHLVQHGTQEVCVMQYCYQAGAIYQPKTGLSGICGRLMTEGTTHHTSLEIVQKLDDYGAQLSVNAGSEISTLYLSSLSKHLAHTLDIVQDVMFNASFPESEFDLHIKRTRQKIEIEEKRTSYHARRIYLPLVLGSTPYSNSMGREELDNITRKDIIDYYTNAYNPGNGFILLSGRFDEEKVLKELNNRFGSVPVHSAPTAFDFSEIKYPDDNAGFHYHHVPDQVQSTLRLGHIGFNRYHPDYHKMKLVNTILGGYFGSRLMSNIREDKGYTYGISSSWVSMRNAGYFIIGTQVGNEFVKPALEEIKKEIHRMRNEKIGEEELSVAKNFLLGRLNSSIETPQQISELVKTMLLFDLPLSGVKEGFEQIKETTADEILTLCQKHCRPDALIELVCGKVDE